MSDKNTKDDMLKGDGGISRKPASSTLSPEKIAQIEASIIRYKPILDELAKR